MPSVFENGIKMCSEALISDCSSLHSCTLMHELVPFTEVHTSVQVHASMHMYCTITHELNNQSVCLVSGEVAQWYQAGLKTRQGLASMGSNPTWVNYFLLKIYLYYFQSILGVTSSWRLLFLYHCTVMLNLHYMTRAC